MKSLERKVIRIFVGDGDYKSQAPLADARRKAGWVIGKDTENQDVRTAMEQANGAIVVINGADANECVPMLAAEALARGARRVILPLDKVKTAFEGKTPLLTRAHEIADRLDIQTALQNPRLTVTPTHIWKKAQERRQLGVSKKFLRRNVDVE